MEFDIRDTIHSDHVTFNVGFSIPLTLKTGV